MLSVKIVRSFLAVILTCVIALNGFVRPAFAADDAVSSFVNGFWYNLGGVVGAATGTVAVCYTADVLIAPVFPPAAVYLTPICATIGVLGGDVVGGEVGVAVGSAGAATIANGVSYVAGAVAGAH